jgi:hypothetical protein
VSVERLETFHLGRSLWAELGGVSARKIRNNDEREEDPEQRRARGRSGTTTSARKIRNNDEPP